MPAAIIGIPVTAEEARAIKALAKKNRQTVAAFIRESAGIRELLDKALSEYPTDSLFRKTEE